MVLQISREDLLKFLGTFSFLENGDDYEKKYASLVINSFPKCEEFWQLIVVPLTNRMGDKSNTPDYIHFRDGVHKTLKDIARLHYSAVMHLIFAHIHVQTPILSSLENTFTHLATACDLAESLIEKWYQVLLMCRGGNSKILQELTREEFLKLAGEWYDENYTKVYQLYYSKGKWISINIPKGINLLHEYYNDSIALIEYLRYSQKIRTYRNALVHDVKLAVINYHDSTYIPRLERIGSYRNWDSVREASKNNSTFDQDFIEQWQQTRECIDGIETCFNNLWEKLIQDLSEEFFSSERNELARMAGIEFTDSLSAQNTLNNNVVGKGKVQFSSATWDSTFASARSTLSGSISIYHDNEGNKIDPPITSGSAGYIKKWGGEIDPPITSGSAALNKKDAKDLKLNK